MARVGWGLLGSPPGVTISLLTFCPLGRESVSPAHSPGGREFSPALRGGRCFRLELEVLLYGFLPSPCPLVIYSFPLFHQKLMSVSDRLGACPFYTVRYDLTACSPRPRIHTALHEVGSASTLLGEQPVPASASSDTARPPPRPAPPGTAAGLLEDLSKFLPLRHRPVQWWVLHGFLDGLRSASVHPPPGSGPAPSHSVSRSCCWGLTPAPASSSPKV